MSGKNDSANPRTINCQNSSVNRFRTKNSHFWKFSAYPRRLILANFNLFDVKKTFIKNSNYILCRQHSVMIFSEVNSVGEDMGLIVNALRHQ